MVLRPRPSTGDAGPEVAGSGGAVRTEVAGAGRAARTIIPLSAAIDYQVFEVTDLLIPAGTDWSSGPGHQLGQINGASRATLIHYKLFFELAAPSTSSFWLMASDAPDWGLTGGNQVSIRGDGGASNFAADGAGVILNQMSTLHTMEASGLDLWLGNRQFSRDVPDPIYVGLYTDAEITEDITVVRARAAFLVL